MIGLRPNCYCGLLCKSCFQLFRPLRDAAQSTLKFGNRKELQDELRKHKLSNSGNRVEHNEGADIVMIKPALAYLDIISLAKAKFNVPLAAYNVSGKYFMVKAAAQNWSLDEKNVVLEILTGIKRAGANIIIMYFAKDVKTWLNQL